jgi:predicted metalloprotease with PDZ domain
VTVLRSVFAVFLLAAASLALAAQAPLGAHVDYSITPILEAGALRAVEIDVRFRGDEDGLTTLRLPDEWGGQNELWRSVSGLSVVSGAEMRDGDGPAARVLVHRPNARIHVRYRVVQDWEGAPSAGQGNPYRAIIQPTYFHLIGNAALIIPEVDGATPVRVHARAMPRGWRFATDLEHRGLTIEDANTSITVGGDFRVIAGEDPNIRIAIRGQWGFSDADLVAKASRIIGGQRRFWNDASEPYLITVIELTSPDPGWISVGGTGLEDAFAFFATPNAPEATITRILAHEGLHTWIPGRIGGMLAENEATDYWLSEGFTDFYTGRILVREGIWSPAQFADDLNLMLAEYAQSLVRTEPNARIVADFWNDRGVQQLPYQRGRLLATIWDARLRGRGAGDLDDVVYAMRARDEPTAVERFHASVAALAFDLGVDVDAFVERGAPILLPEDAFAPCGRIETRDAPNFHRGFDIEATTANNNVIAGVIRGGPAYAAGMRDGMVLVRREAGEIGNAELEIAYVVRDGDVERTLRYMPRDEGSFTLQRLVIDKGLSGEALDRCIAVLAGR